MYREGDEDKLLVIENANKEKGGFSLAKTSFRLSNSFQ